MPIRVQQIVTNVFVPVQVWDNENGIALASPSESRVSKSACWTAVIEANSRRLQSCATRAGKIAKLKRLGWQVLRVAAFDVEA